jgi:hypothetical protein
MNPDEPLSVLEKHTFGADAKRNPVTGMVLEQGVGAWPADQQALLHCQIIEERDGNAAADAMRRKLRAAAQPPVAVVPS